MEVLEIKDNIIGFSDLKIKYLKVLFKQAKEKDFSLSEIGKSISIDEILSILQSRSIFNGISPVQFFEEKELLPELTKLFEYLNTIK